MMVWPSHTDWRAFCCPTGQHLTQQQIVFGTQITNQTRFNQTWPRRGGVTMASQTERPAWSPCKIQRVSDPVQIGSLVKLFRNWDLVDTYGDHPWKCHLDQLKEWLQNEGTGPPVVPRTVPQPVDTDLEIDFDLPVHVDGAGLPDDIPTEPREPTPPEPPAAELSGTVPAVEPCYPSWHPRPPDYFGLYFMVHER